ncbi:MAG: carboxylating nicotinate-nucleotide diphosphorylase [Planctomycetia bacterium]|nr:carboxylating nicotinate-nucleotide diphosphorylase [Planctomycetia bacterium]
MKKEFLQQKWDAIIEKSLCDLMRLAMREDSDGFLDITSLSLIPEEAKCRAAIVARSGGVLAGAAGLPAFTRLFNQEREECWVDGRVRWEPVLKDGAVLAPGTVVGHVSGSAQAVLCWERLALNLLGHLSGIATSTKACVDAICGTNARIYDTRKTTLAWRRLEKYAVRCGGGHNHRMGLYDHVLIKDNHLAHGATTGITPGQAVRDCRDYIKSTEDGEQVLKNLIIEVEVDTLDQLRDVLTQHPDIVLLDNMSCETMRNAVTLRNELSPETELEASGGITLQTLRAVAESGVERISLGALTHSAKNLDLGLDYEMERKES